MHKGMELNYTSPVGEVMWTVRRERDSMEHVVYHVNILADVLE